MVEDRPFKEFRFLFEEKDERFLRWNPRQLMKRKLAYEEGETQAWGYGKAVCEVTGLDGVRNYEVSAKLVWKKNWKVDRKKLRCLGYESRLIKERVTIRIYETVP